MTELSIAYVSELNTVSGRLFCNIFFILLPQALSKYSPKRTLVMLHDIALHIFSKELLKAFCVTGLVVPTLDCMRSRIFFFYGQSGFNIFNDGAPIGEAKNSPLNHGDKSCNNYKSMQFIISSVQP